MQCVMLIKKLQAIGDHIYDCLTVVDNESKERPCVYANQRFYDQTGYSEAEVIGKNLKFLQGKGTNGKTIAFMRVTLNKHKALCVDLLNHRKNGDAFLNRLVMIPFLEKGKQFFLGLQNDITHQKNLHFDAEEVKKYNDGYLRHMVNNKLMVVMGNARLDRSGQHDASDQLERAILDLNKFCRELHNEAEFAKYASLAG